MRSARRTALWWALILGALTPPVVAGAQQPSEIQAQGTIRLGARSKRTLSPTTTHEWTLDLPANRYVRVRVFQEGIDVVVRVLSPAGAVISEVDSPNGDAGAESVGWITGVGGTWRVNVAPLEGTRPGDYVILVDATRTATAVDRDHVAAADSGRALGAAGLAVVREGTVAAAERALDLWRRAVAWFGKSDDEPSAVPWLAIIGNVQDQLGRADSALAYALRALVLQRGISDRAGELVTLGRIGSLYYRSQRPDSALAYFREALTIERAMADRDAEGVTLSNIGVMFQQLGQPDSAMASYEAALGALAAGRNRRSESTTLSNIASIHDALGRPDSALIYYNRALAIRREIGDSAGAALVSGYIAEAQRDLDRTAAEARPLRLVPTVGHTLFLMGAAYSPDGRLVVTSGFDGTARIWEAATGRQVRSLGGDARGEAVEAAVFSPDGRIVLTGDLGGLARLWDVASGREVRRMTAPRGMRSADFSPDGREIVTAGDSGSVGLWAPASATFLHSLAGHHGNVNAGRFSPDGRTVATVGDDSTGRLWDVASGRELLVLRPPSSLDGCAFSPDGRYLATAGSDGKVRIWDVTFGREVQVLGRDTTVRATAVAFAADGRRVAASYIDGAIAVWQLPDPHPVQVFKGAGGTLVSVAFSPDGRNLLAAFFGPMAVIIDATTGNGVQLLSEPTGFLTSAAFSPDGRWVMFGGGVVTQWETATGRHMREFAGAYFALSPDGRRVATFGLRDSTLHVWEQSGTQLAALRVPGLDVKAAALSSDPKTALAGYSDGTARLWSLERRQPLRTLTGHAGPLNDVALSPDGKYAATAGSDSVARIWETSTGRLLSTIGGFRHVVISVGFAPGSPLVLAGSVDGSVALYDVAAGREVRRIDAGVAVLHAEFSPDGRRIAVAGNLVARLLDVETGNPVREFRGHSHAVRSAAVSPDGRFLLTTAQDNTARLWSVETGEELFLRVELQRGDWVVVAPDGRFDGTEAGVSRLHYARGAEAIGLQAFFGTFYTPRLTGAIFSGAPYTGPDLRRGFGLPPLVRILSPAPHDTVSGEVTVAVAVTDRGGGVRDIRLYHNSALVGSAVRGMGGARAGVCPSGATCFRVALLTGDNAFEATAFASDGTEAERARVTVQVAGAKPTATLHVLAIGINAYRNPRYSLNYGRADAAAFVDSVTAGAGGMFARVVVDTLYDGQATKATITASLVRLASEAQPQDVFVFYYAGHGTAEVVGDSSRFYLVPSDVTQLSDPQQLAALGISDGELRERFIAVPARKKLMVIDACQSGQLLTSFARRGVAEERAIAQLAHATGIFVMSATDSDQFAAEVQSLGHGVFTYGLLEAISGDHVGQPRERMVGEIVSAAARLIPELSARHRTQPQYPIVFSNGQDFPLVVR